MNNRSLEKPSNGQHAGDKRSLGERIRAHYDRLSESERRIADLILDFPGEVAAYSATELAEISGGSKAAVSRMVRRLGYANFDEARRAARDAQTWGSPLYLLSKDTASYDFKTRIAFEIQQDSQNIALTMENLDSAVLEQVVEAICISRRVLFLGFRNSYYLAGYARSQISQVRKNTCLLPVAGETIAEEFADLTDKDLVIIIGFRRRVAKVLKAVASARALGAKVLYITDRSAQANSEATWTLPCAVSSSDLFDRYASAMCLLHFLGVSVVKRLSAEGRSRLQNIETLHRQMHEFD